MQRSYIALAVVIIAAAVALFIHLQPAESPPPPPLEEKEGAKAPPPEKKGPEEKAPPPEKKAPEKKAPPKEKAKEPEAVDPDAVQQAAQAHLAAGKPAEAMKTLSQALAKATEPATVQSLKAQLTALTQKHFFSPEPSPLALTHTVQPGENLTRLAAKHTTTPEYIARLNGLPDPDRVQAGKTLKIVPGAYDVVIVKSQYLLTVLKDGVWIRDIRVGLGKDGSTPVGEFVAGDKIRKPPYTAVFPHIPFGDKKNNPLGTRWITIQGAGSDEYGIHGTWEPDSIGREMSKGCIRMLNEDVEWLFDLIVPGKSRIIIRP